MLTVIKFLSNNFACPKINSFQFPVARRRSAYHLTAGFDGVVKSPDLREQQRKGHEKYEMEQEEIRKQQEEEIAKKTENHLKETKEQAEKIRKRMEKQDE
ncbi:hypothetical protein BV898_03289 [Hypsibius exemplaris]|uniref:Uncharacterized protein n=1 Tax=Hypsibius exemplaris TaxID=2072580 RepID=A0A1W0X5J2_HYPEX|nr:hypothetical protein BV898_03289 [Hypsibius exemplaris]